MLDPRTPTLWPATTTNCVVLGCGDVLLVDPATPYEDERARFDDALDVGLAGRRVCGVFLTHHHHDHVGDAMRQRARHGCPIFAHARTAERLAGEVVVDEVIDEGHVFRLSGNGAGPDRAFQALHTPGHAAGHLCLWEPTLRLLIAGDMIAGVGSILIDPDEGHMATYVRSLERLIALGPRALIPAHGPLLTDAVARLAHQRDHRLAREAKVLAAVRAGARTLDDIVTVAYGPDTPQAMLAFAARSTMAILIKLEESGAVRREGGGAVAA